MKVVSQFSEHDPNGQSIRAARGIARYDRRGWRRWLVPSVLGVVGLAAVSLLVVLLTR